MIDATRIGVLLATDTPPEDIAGLAREVEALGLGQLWVAEDYFRHGGLTVAGIALAATSHLRVGIGVVAASVRHPAVLAMELATLSRAYPGRLIAGIGHGAPAWIAQMDLTVSSPMTVLRDCVRNTAALLAGETVTAPGFDAVTLTHPPMEQVPIVLGVMGDRGLELAGSAADGLVVSVMATPGYVAHARTVTDTAAAGRAVRPRISVLTFASIATDPARRPECRDGVRETLAGYLSGPRPLFADVDGANERLARGRVTPGEIADDWVDAMSAAGTIDDLQVRIDALLAAGADDVLLVPTPVTGAQETLRAAATLLS